MLKETVGHFEFCTIAMKLNQYRGYKETLDEFKSRVMKMWRESKSD